MGTALEEIFPLSQNHLTLQFNFQALILILPSIHIENVWVPQWELIVESALNWASYEMPSFPYCTTYFWSVVRRRKFTLITPSTFKSFISDWIDSHRSIIQGCHSNHFWIGNLHDGIIWLQLPECILLQSLLCRFVSHTNDSTQKKNTEYSSLHQSVLVVVVKWSHHVNALFAVLNYHSFSVMSSHIAASQFLWRGP